MRELRHLAQENLQRLRVVGLFDKRGQCTARRLGLAAQFFRRMSRLFQKVSSVEFNADALGGGLADEFRLRLRLDIHC